MFSSSGSKEMGSPLDNLNGQQNWLNSQSKNVPQGPISTCPVNRIWSEEVIDGWGNSDTLNLPGKKWLPISGRRPTSMYFKTQYYFPCFWLFFCVLLFLVSDYGLFVLRSKQLFDQEDVDVVFPLDKEKGITLEDFKLIKMHMASCIFFLSLSLSPLLLALVSYYVSVLIAMNWVFVLLLGIGF